MAHPQPDQQQGRTLLRIGMVTDLHWNGHKEVIGTRHYQDSLTKLNEAIQTFHQQGVDFAVNLGDTLDSLIEADSDLDRLRCTYQSCDFRWYHVLGNHDSDMCGEPPDRHIFVRAFGMAGPYYSFDESDIHFVVLDGNYAEDGVDWSPSWDRTWLGGGQLEWLVEDLRANREKLVFILVHQLAVPPDEEASSDRGHALRDAEQLRAVLESNPNVHAVFALGVTTKPVVCRRSKRAHGSPPSWLVVNEQLTNV